MPALRFVEIDLSSKNTTSCDSQVVQNYQLALTLNWSSAILFINMGEALEALGRYTEAIPYAELAH